jgi:hypothetical protein
MMKSALLVAAPLLAAAWIGTADAQATPPSGALAGPLHVIDDGRLVVAPWGMRVAAIERLHLHAVNGAKMAAVKRVIGDAAGSPVAVVVEYGGALGLGGKEVIVPLGHLSPRNDRIVTELTMPQLQAMPAWSK